MDLVFAKSILFRNNELAIIIHRQYGFFVTHNLCTFNLRPLASIASQSYSYASFASL